MNKHRVKLDLFLLVASALLVFHTTLSIPYLHSEIAGISANPVVLDIATFWERMVSWRGLFQRPLSVLSFTLNHRFGGAEPWHFHLVNVAIHLLNALLVYSLARSYKAHPLISAMIFLLHPLSTSAASQIFGRSYSLGTSFMLLALLLYFRRQNNLIQPLVFKGITLLLLFLMVCSKQTFVVFPLLLFWHWVYSNPLSLKTFFRSAAALVASLFSFTAAALFIFIYAIPLSRTAVVSPWVYLCSQFGNYKAFLSLYFLPNHSALIHELNFYGDALNFDVICGFSLWLALLALAVCFRRQPIGLLLGALLILLIPTNSFLPKNEVVREWRLYPSLWSFSLLGGLLFSTLWKTPRPALLRVLLSGSFIALLSFFSLSIVRQNQHYQSREAAWRDVLRKYPNSTDAINNIGFELAQQGELDEAVLWVRRAIKGNPKISLYYKNLAELYRKQGKEKLAEEMVIKSAVTAAVFGARSMAVPFSDRSD